MAEAPKWKERQDVRTGAALQPPNVFFPSSRHRPPSLDGMGSLTLFVFLVLSLVLLANAADLYKVLDR